MRHPRSDEDLNERDGGKNGSMVGAATKIEKAGKKNFLKTVSFRKSETTMLPRCKGSRVEVQKWHDPRNYPGKKKEPKMYTPFISFVHLNIWPTCRHSVGC